MQVYTLTETEFQSVYNHSKTILLQYLERNNLLKETTAEELDKQLVIVIARKGMFGQLFDKFWGTSDDKGKIFVTKVG